MSVINRMLQDLERRGHDGENGSSAGIKPVAPRHAPERPVWWLLALAAALGVIVLLAWLLLRQMTAVREPRAPVAAAPAAPVRPAPSPVPAPELVSLRLSDLPALPGAAISAKKAEPPPAHAEPASAPAPVREAGSKPEPVEAAKPVEKDAGSAKKNEAAVKQITPRQRAEYLYQQAVSLVQQGRMAEAQGSLDEALKAAPAHAAARQVLAGILVDNKQYAQAEQLLRDGLDVGTVQPEFVMALARIQIERGDGRAALETLQKNQAGAKDNAAYQAFLAALLQRQGLHKQAIEHYQISLRLAPSASALVGIGISLQAENRLAEAQEAFNRAKSSGALNAELQGFVEQRLGQIQQQLR
ncbi:MAG: tetratricopeptide repeat protein [Sulfuricella sp.]|nr:tetratricopeptide repeat protein [Sulfuricella sp.]